jgi:AsmA protein
MPSRKRRRRQSHQRLIVIAGTLAAICALPFAVLGLLVATVNPNRLKPRIEAAFSQSLGRALRIHGDVAFDGTFWPTIVARDVTVANAPGGSRPEMVQIDEVRMDLSRTAALSGRTVLKNLVLLRPDILLETAPNGIGNWQLSQMPAPAPAPPAGKPPPPSGESKDARVVPGITLQTLHIHEAHVTWHDRATGADSTFEINRISATSNSVYSPVKLGAEVTIARHLIEISAETGPLSRLQDTQAQSPWGLFVNMDTSGAKLTVSGSMTRPLELRGYTLRVDGVVQDLSRIDWVSPVALPPLRGVTLSAKLLDQGGPIPDISGVTIESGPTNLEKVAAGLSIDVARIDVPRLTEPAQITVEGAMLGAPVKLNASLGAPALLLPGGRRGEAFAINIAGEAVGATLSARGSIGSPATQSGMDVFLSLRIPDLSRLSPLIGAKLPAVKSISFDGRLTDTDKGLWNGIMLRDSRLSVPEADIYGDAALLFGSRPGIRMNLLAREIDADALTKVIGPYAGWMPALADLSSDLPGPAPYAQNKPPVITAIPATPLPFGVLTAADLDLSLTLGDLRLGGAVYRDIAGHLVLRNGALALDPFSVRLRGGKVEAKLRVDAGKPVPQVALALHGPGLELGPLGEAFDSPVQGSGTIDIDADLHAAGASLHAIAGSLDGHLDLGIAEADIDNRILGPALAGLSTRIDPSEGDKTRLRCAVLQAEARHGVVSIGTLVLDSRRFLINAAGSLNLDSETFALSVRPMLRTNGPGVVVPVRVDGTFRSPKIGPNAPTAGAAVSYPSEHGADACGPALAAVRARPSSIPAAAAAGVVPAPSGAPLTPTLPAMLPLLLPSPPPGP